MQQWLSPISDYAQRIQPLVVDIVKAALVLLIGVFVARYLERWSRRVAQAAVDKAGGQRAAMRSAAAHQLAQSVPTLVGRFVYWLAFLLFLSAAVEVVGLPVA